jgi:hypothetical protein
MSYSSTSQYLAIFCNQLSLFVGEKLEFLENFNIFVILAYELPNRILMLGKSEDFFFTFFLQMKSTIKLNFSKFEL